MMTPFEKIIKATGRTGQRGSELMQDLNILARKGLIVLNLYEDNPIAYVTTPGDRSVGISPDEVQVVGLPTKEYREDMRKDLKEGFRELLQDSRVSVHFSDECSECGAKLDEESRCTNKNCIENLHFHNE